MTSRVEELQRMCDNINENGGLDSGKWHMALLTQIAQNLAVIADVMMADRKTEPQTERMKTLDYCDICNHKRCDNCITNNLDDYCVPSGYTPKDAPQTDCETCRHYKLACELFSEVCKYEPTTQTETQNSNLTFEKDECAKEYEELGLKELKELINADRKTENSSEKPNNYEPKTEPQTGQLCDGCEYSEPYIEYKCTHPSCKYGD